MARKKL